MILKVAGVPHKNDFPATFKKKLKKTFYYKKHFNNQTIVKKKAVFLN